MAFFSILASGNGKQKKTEDAVGSSWLTATDPNADKVLVSFVNVTGLALSLAGAALLLVRNRIITNAATRAEGNDRLRRYWLGGRWLDMGVAGLVVGFALQLIAGIL